MVENRDYIDCHTQLTSITTTLWRLYQERDSLRLQVQRLHILLGGALLVGILLGVLLWGSAEAAPLQPGVYRAEGAVSDPLLSPYTHTHGLSLEGQEYPFTGFFTLAGDGVLTGEAGPYFLHLSLLSYTPIPPVGSPKLELLPTAYGGLGGVLPGEWQYFQEATLFLTSPSGIQEYTRFGPAFQLGEGANGKNSLLGLSGWFGEQGVMKGDINVALSPVPEPSSFWLWLAGGFGLLVGRIIRLYRP